MDALTKEQQDLVADHLYVARRVAARYASKQPHVPYDDLYSICLESLCKAALTYTTGSFAARARLEAIHDVLNVLEKSNHQRSTEICPPVSEDDDDAPDFGDIDYTSPEDLYAVKEYYESQSLRDQDIIDMASQGYTHIEIAKAMENHRHTIDSRIKRLREDY